MLLRTFTNKSSEIHVPLFKSLVRPHLEYSNSVWNPYLKNDINRLEKVQKNYTKRIQGMMDLSYQQRLEILKLPSLLQTFCLIFPTHKQILDNCQILTD